MTTPPPEPQPNDIGLPDDIGYPTIHAAMTLLLPGVDLRRIMFITMDARNVIVGWWDGRQEQHTRIPQSHPQGAYTEGGQQT